VKRLLSNWWRASAAIATLSNYRTDAPDALYTEKEINKWKKRRQVGGHSSFH
jgi:hypothetical protein